MSILKPFQLLEINVISAQDLELVSKTMRTYATAWVQPKRKLSTRMDVQGYNNPTWNDKFVFRVDEEFLRLDVSAVMIQIYAANWFRDTLVGTVRVLVGNLIPPPVKMHHRPQHHLGMRFVALQVRRPSGRPQGILNLGVAVLDSSMRSMPLYSQLSASAVGYRDLMGEEGSNYQNHHNSNPHNYPPPPVKPILRRTRSERSERVRFDNASMANSSIVAIPQNKGIHEKASSIVSGSEFGDPLKWKLKKGKASSVISGAELREKPKHKGPKGKAISLISGSVISTNSMDPLTKKMMGEKEKASPLSTGFETGPPPKVTSKTATIGKPISKLNGYELGGSNRFLSGSPQKANSTCADSELGPPPSEVAAAMAMVKYPLEDDQSSVLDGWSLDESVEGLRTKLERWRTELPPIYDRGLSSLSSFRSTSHHVQRHTNSGSGLFSCFGNIYGYECQCVCGKPRERKKLGPRFSPSIGSAGRSFI